MTETPQNWFFTFGPDHLHPVTGMSLGRHYVRVYGTCDSTREAMFAVFGRNWAFQYSAATFNARFATEIPMPVTS